MTIDEYIRKNNICPFDDVLDVIDLMKKYAQATNGWRSVEDELPEVGINVLVYRINKKFAIAHISNSNSWYDYNRPIEYEVIHWMPLPSEPEL